MSKQMEASGIVQRATIESGALRCYAAITTNIIENVRRRHGLYPTATAAVGRTLTATGIMGAMLKDEQSVMVEIRGDGPLGKIVADANAAGDVRAYATNPGVHLPLNAKGKLDVAGAVGAGTLYVTKDLQLKEPYHGMVPLVSGEIAEDFAHYFVQSEQVPSAVSLGVIVEPDQSVQAGGGLIIQAMPDADEQLLSTVEKRLRSLQSVSRMVTMGMTPVDMIEAVFHGLDISLLDEQQLHFHCPCSMERYSRALIALGPAELQSIIEEQGEAELVCNFCTDTYEFTKDELQNLLDEAKDKQEK